MRQDLFWLSDTQWEAVKACLPDKHRGPRRLSDRTVISGIIFVLQSGCAWRACPQEYGAYMTVFNRFNRWKHRAIWLSIVAAVTRDEQSALTVLGGVTPKSKTMRRPPEDGGITRSASIPDSMPGRPAQRGAHRIGTTQTLDPAALELAVECIAYYAAGGVDSGSRAKETLQILFHRRADTAAARAEKNSGGYRWVGPPRKSSDRNNPVVAQSPPKMSTQEEAERGPFELLGNRRWLTAD